MADRIGIMSEGRLVQLGTPREIYERPRNVYVAGRLGSPRSISCRRSFCRPSGAPAGTRTIGARTEHLRIRPANGGARATVRRVEHLGDQNHLHVEIDGRALVTLADPHAALKAGDTVSVDLVDPALFRRRRAAGIEARSHDRSIARLTIAGLIEAVARRGDRSRRGADRARPGDRRRRPRPQHEARLRGRAGGHCRHCWRKPLARGAEGGRHHAGDEGRRRLRPALRHAVHERSARRCPRHRREPAVARGLRGGGRRR